MSEVESAHTRTHGWVECAMSKCTYITNSREEERERWFNLKVRGLH